MVLFAYGAVNHMNAPLNFLAFQIRLGAGQYKEVMMKGYHPPWHSMQLQETISHVDLLTAKFVYLVNGQKFLNIF